MKKRISSFVCLLLFVSIAIGSANDDVDSDENLSHEDDTLVSAEKWDLDDNEPFLVCESSKSF